MLVKTVLIFSLVVGSVSCTYGTNISVNGESVQFTEQTGYPYVDTNNRTQVPLRVTMEKAGATVTWNKETKTAKVEKTGKVVEIPIGSDFILVDGKQVATDTAAVIVDGKTYLPIRAVLEAVDFGVQWDQTTQTVHAASFADYVKNQDKVLAEQRQNINSVEDLINYYRSSYQQEKDKKLVRDIAERDAINRLTSEPLVFAPYLAWYDANNSNSFEGQGLSADYSNYKVNVDYGNEPFSDDNTITFGGEIILSGNGKHVTIQIPEFSLLRKEFDTEKSKKVFDGITMNFYGEYKTYIKYQGEELYKLGLISGINK